MRASTVLLIPLVGCAKLLSYDDYEPRPSAQVDVGVEVAVEDTSVADTGPPPARVPSRPAGPTTPSGKGKTLWLAARTYAYGLTDSTGTISSSAWASYGWDLDQLCTGSRESVENLGTCLRPAGAKQDSLVDGELCRDNNFGRSIGAFLTAIPDMEKSLNTLVFSGSTTWILRIDDLDDGDDAFAPGALYRSSDDRAGTLPKWDGSDDRAVQADSLVDGDLTRPVLSFPGGYVASGVWVSGDPMAMKIIAPITAIGFFPLNLVSARFTLSLDATHTTGQHGLLSGALPASEIETSFHELADFARICPGTALYDESLSTLKATPDLVANAPNLQDTSRTCDAVSTTVGFEVTPIKPVTRVVPPMTPRLRRCGDAG